MSSSAAHVVLVHGAWADGSSWSKVIALLQAKGIDAVAVQLPLTTLSGDVATVKRAIALQDGPVVLAGHSHGGAVITEAAAGSTLRFYGLVFNDQGVLRMDCAQINDGVPLTN